MVIGISNGAFILFRLFILITLCKELEMKERFIVLMKCNSLPLRDSIWRHKS